MLTYSFIDLLILIKNILYSPVAFQILDQIGLIVLNIFYLANNIIIFLNYIMTYQFNFDINKAFSRFISIGIIVISYLIYIIGGFSKPLIVLVILLNIFIQVYCLILNKNTRTKQTVDCIDNGGRLHVINTGNMTIDRTPPRTPNKRQGITTPIKQRLRKFVLAD